MYVYKYRCNFNCFVCYIVTGAPYKPMNVQQIMGRVSVREACEPTANNERNMGETCMYTLNCWQVLCS
jgi:hypothetical protein